MGYNWSRKISFLMYQPNKKSRDDKNENFEGENDWLKFVKI